MLLTLTLLGPVRLQANDQALPLATHKARALLVLLAIGGPAPRSRLAAWLWPGLDAASARRNLRRELARLPRIAPVVVADGDLLAPAANLRCDAAAFDAAVAAGRDDEALALWSGLLAEGLRFDDGGPFVDWLQAERRRLALLRRQALQRGASRHEAAGDRDAALACVHALLADDPLDEAGHREAMRLQAAAGRRDEALAQYQRCRDQLARELDALPGDETEALREAIAGSPRRPADRHPNGAARPPFVGRDDALALMRQAAAAGRTIVIEGVAGIGKSTLAHHFAERQGAYAWVPCRAGDDAVPFAAFARALRAMAGGALDLAMLPAWVAAELARILPELGAAAGPIAGAEQQQRFVEAGSAAWSALAAGNFDSTVIDDWHLADDASRGLFAQAAGHAGAPRLVVTLRPGLDAAARAALQQLLDGGALHVGLPALNAPELAQWLCEACGTALPPQVGERLERATGGNPFFVAETLRHWQQLRLLEPDGAGGWRTAFGALPAPLPGSVHEAVRSRVRRLPEAAQRLLEAASQAPEPFAALLLAEACRMSEIEALDAIGIALAAQLLREHDGGGHGFEHDLVRAALDAELTPGQRRLVNRRLALGAENALRALGAEGAARLSGAEYAALTPAQVARHWEAGGEPRRAVPHRIAAAEAALALNRGDTAFEHWRAALDDGPTPAEHRRVLSARLLLEHRRNDRPAVEATLVELDRLRAEWARDAGTVPVAREASIDAAEACALQVRITEASRRIDELLATLPSSACPEARLLSLRSRVLNSLGRGDEATAAAEAALAAGVLGPLQESTLLNALTYSHYLRGDLRAALAYAERSLALARAGGTRGAPVARALATVGTMQCMLGQGDRAVATYDEARALAAEWQMVEVQRDIASNLASLRLDRGETAAAVATAEQALGIAAHFVQPEKEVNLLADCVQGRYRLGQLGAALRDAERLGDRLDRIENKASRINAVSMVLDLYTDLGDAPGAERVLGRLDGAADERLADLNLKLAFNLVRHGLVFATPAAARAHLAAVAPHQQGERHACDVARLATCHAEIALAEGDAAAAAAWLDDAGRAHPDVVTAATGAALRLVLLRLLGRRDADADAAAASWCGDERTPRFVRLRLLHERWCAAQASHDAAAARALRRERDTALLALAASLGDRPHERGCLLRRWQDAPVDAAAGTDAARRGITQRV